MPVWSFEELQDYSSLLDDARKLTEKVLILKNEKFGGIPRYMTESLNDFELTRDIDNFSQLYILSYSENYYAVMDEN
jgi:hypothetical protein